MVETSSHKEVCNLISFLYMKHFSPLEIYSQLMKVCDDGTVRMQDATELCRGFDSGQTDIWQSVGHRKGIYECGMSGGTDLGGN